MSVIWTRSGIMKPEYYKQAIEMSEQMVARFKEKTGIRAGLYHQMGGDIGRLGVLTVFEDLAQFQEVMREATASQEASESRGEHAMHFLPETRKETIWIGRQ